MNPSHIYMNTVIRVLYVTEFAKTILNHTFCISKNTSFKGELTWKIYLCILLPKYVYLFIQCTKNMF